MNGRKLVWLTLFALGAVAVLAATSAVADPADINNPPTSDWFFDSGNTVIIAHRTWDIHYNITVANDTKLAFTECTFTFSDPADINSRYIWGMWNASVIFNNCTFKSTGNAKYFLYIENSTKFMGCSFSGMRAPGTGMGGINVFWSEVEFQSTTIRDTDGVGVWAENCNITADSLTVTGSGYDSTDGASFMAMYMYNSWEDSFFVDVVDSSFIDNPYRGFGLRAYSNWADITASFSGCQISRNGQRGLDIYWGRDGYYETSNASLEVTVFQCTFDYNYWDGFRYQQYDIRMNADSTVSITLEDSVFKNIRGSGAFINVYRGDQAFDLVVDGCEFLDNAYGGRAGLAFSNRYMYNHWNISVTDTNFDNNDYYGLHIEHYSTMMEGDHISVSDCTFSNHYAGMYVYNYRGYDYFNDIFVTDCSFSTSEEAGYYQYISYSQLPIDMMFDGCDFTNSEGAGISVQSGNDQSDGVHLEVQDCTFNALDDRAIKFNMDYVMAGATLEVDGSSLDMTGGIEFTVRNSIDTVQAHHEMRVENCDITNSTSSAVDANVFGYYGVDFWVDIDTVTITDALFNGLQVLANSNYAAATRSIDLDLTISDLNIDTVGGNGINVGTDRINYPGTRTIDVDGLSIATVNKAIVLNGVKGDLYSTSITASLKEDVTAINSDVEIYQPTLDALNEDTVVVIESGSVKFWYTLGVLVQWDTGIAVEGAVVKITDNQHTLIGVYTQTDDTGLDDILLNSFQFRETGLFTRSPYLLNVSFKAINRVVPVNLDGNKRVTVELADHVAPNIIINEPMPGHLQKETTIAVRGAAYDSESDVDKVEVSINGVDWMMTATTIAWQYAFTVTHQDIIDNGGMFTVRARASDLAGNEASTFTTVEIDPFPPELRVDHPYDGLQTNDATLTVRGVTEAGATVTVNGEEVVVAGTLFVAQVALVEGPNTITVDAFDMLGNSKQEKMEVVLDTKPPYLVLLTPTEGEMFTEPSAMVSGQAEEDLVIMVNGNKLGQNHYDNGTFEYAVSLARGNNIITVEAVDMAGNTISIMRTVLLDDVPPILAVQSPIDGSHQNDMTIMVIGTTNDDSFLLINGNLVELDHGLFSYSLVGVEGLNEVIISASDIAGNVVKVTLTVNIDTVGPTMEISAPPMEEKMVTNASYVIQGQSDGAVSVFINGDPHDVETDGSFSIPVTLLEGQNRFIITVVDLAGNSVTENRFVTLDTIPPVLVVRIPDIIEKNDKMVFRTKKGEPATMRIVGFTDDAIQIRVNGDLVAVSNDGYFVVDYLLDVNSVNTITVTAVDAAGNSVEITESVTHKYLSDGGDDGLDWGFIVLILGIILLAIVIFIGWRRLSAVEESQEIVVEEDEVLAPAAMPVVEEEEEEEVEEEDEEEDLVVDDEEEEEEEVHELTPPSERPKTDTSRPAYETPDEEVTIEIDEKDLEEKDAEGDVDADESEQKEGI